MLMLVGHVLDVTTRTGGREDNPFTYREVALLLGRTRVERVPLARSFDGDEPKRGEDCALVVMIDTWVTKAGRPAYRFKALSRADDSVVTALVAIADERLAVASA